MTNQPTFTQSLMMGALVNVGVYPLEILRIRTLFRQVSCGTWQTWRHGWLTSVSVGSLKAGLTYGFQGPLQTWYETKWVLSPFQALQLSGATVGGCNAFLFSPFNVLKTRIQASHTVSSWWQQGQAVYRQYGILGFYRGVTPLLARDMIWGWVLLYHLSHLSHLPHGTATPL